MVYAIVGKADRVRRWLEPFAPSLEYEEYFSIRIMAHFCGTIPVSAVTNKGHLKCQYQNGHGNLFILTLSSSRPSKYGRLQASRPIKEKSYVGYSTSNWLVQYFVEVTTALTSYILISIQSGGGAVPHNAKTGSEAISLPK
eukprot:scaffold18770_cov65-Attheya_sp.AAC.2